MTFPDYEILQSIVARIFRIEQVVLGDERRGFIAHYRGQLYNEDSAAAYEQLADALRSYHITPLFRLEKGQQIIVLLPGVTRPGRARISTNIALFILTLLSVMFAGATYSYQGPLPEDTLGLVLTLIRNLWTGWPFAVSLLAILLAHEFGHYFAGRFNRTEVTLPYFIPFPLSLLGTMGAFIQLKERPRNKRVLLDIGIAGPLAGLIVAIPVLVIGLALSEVGRTENTYYVKEPGRFEACQNAALAGDSYSCPSDNLLEGNSMLYLGLKYLVKGELLPAPAAYDQPALLYWTRYVFTGQPIPVGGRDVLLHPVAMAGWAGILVTFLNLIPAGQLDGGHVLYAIFGRRVRTIPPVILAVLVGMGFIWNGWWLWAGLIFFVGRGHAEPMDEITSLDPPRKALAVLMLAIFLLVLTPVPFITF